MKLAVMMCFHFLHAIIHKIYSPSACHHAIRVLKNNNNNNNPPLSAWVYFMKTLSSERQKIILRMDPLSTFGKMDEPRVYTATDCICSLFAWDASPLCGSDQSGSQYMRSLVQISPYVSSWGVTVWNSWMKWMRLLYKSSVKQNSVIWIWKISAKQIPLKFTLCRLFVGALCATFCVHYVNWYP